MIVNGRVLQPSSCPVCRFSNNRHHPITTVSRSLRGEGNDYMCGYCGSFFWWDAETRRACGLETRYPFTRAGWNTSIVSIGPRWLKGDPCPRCEADVAFREDFFMGNGGRCVICNGDGVYPGDD